MRLSCDAICKVIVLPTHQRGQLSSTGSIRACSSPAVDGKANCSTCSGGRRAARNRLPHPGAPREDGGGPSDLAIGVTSMARAKAKGSKTGNPIGRPAVGIEVETQIRELRGQGMGMIKFAKRVGCGVSVVQRVDAITA